jgi:hypothetical protein
MVGEYLTAKKAYESKPLEKISPHFGQLNMIDEAIKNLAENLEIQA